MTLAAYVGNDNTIRYAVLDDLDLLPRLGTGSYRETFDLGDGHVLKRNWDYRTTNGAADEAQVWAAVEGTSVERYFCPVKGIDPKGRWIVMPKADSIGYPNCKAADGSDDYSKQYFAQARFGEWVRAHAHAAGDVEVELSDLHNGNVGMLDDHLVIVDYGHCHSSKKTTTQGGTNG